MSLLNEIQEAARQARTGDDWYTTNQAYILEIRSTPGLSGFATGRAYIVFPRGPEQYSVKRVFRQSVTPTLGGLVVEERGLLWRDIHIRGTFGLTPVFSFDTSGSVPDGDPSTVSPLGEALSGPGWTRRMIRNYFEKYAALKADPVVASKTMLVWHDTKTNDSWVVIPQEVDVDRDNQRRMQYPWTLQLRAVAKDEGQIPTPPTANLRGIGWEAEVIASVNKSLALINSAVQEGSAILGEVRFFVATIDSTIDKLATITTSLDDFLNGVSRTISVGRAFITGTAAEMEAQLKLMEDAADLPDVVRQNYQMALDGLHKGAAQNSAFGETYEDNADTIAASEAGASGDSDEILEEAEDSGAPRSASEMERRRVRSTDTTLVDTEALKAGRVFAKYRGFMDYAIRAIDTLTSIAAKFLGDGALWYDLAIINGLNHPYISETGAPGTVGVGDIISVPVINAPGPNAIASGEGSEPGEGILGTDIRLIDSEQAGPGRPVVEIAIDRRTLRDVQTISGFSNYAQAIQLRIWTERGRMPLLPEYGLTRTIGIKQSQAFLALLRLDLLRTIRADSRTQGIGAVRFEPVDDLIEADIDVTPIGTSTSRTVSTSLV